MLIDMVPYHDRASSVRYSVALGQMLNGTSQEWAPCQ